MSTDSPRYSHFVCVAVDVKGYSDATEREHAEIQTALIRMLESAGMAAEVDRSAWLLQTAGDSELALIPLVDDVSVPSSVVDYIVHLAAALLRHNASRPDAKRLRLRLAVDHGVAAQAPAGFAGDVVVAVNRLLDSQPVRKVLDADPTVNLAVILSERFHKDYVRSEHTKLRSEHTRPVEVQVKGYTGKAWLWAPGTPVTALSPISARSKAPAVSARSASAPRRWMFGAVALAVGLLVGGTVAWRIAAGHGEHGVTSDRSLSPGASPAARSEAFTLTSGDRFDVLRGMVGTDLADANLEFHPRYSLSDQFQISPWGSARLAKAANVPTRDSCDRLLAQRSDDDLVLTEHGAADGGNLAVGDWVCLAPDSSHIAAIHVVRLDSGLPGGVELAATLWAR